MKRLALDLLSIRGFMAFINCSQAMQSNICRSSPYILVGSDLPWAGGALDLFCFISELCVAACVHAVACLPMNTAGSSIQLQFLRIKRHSLCA
jgi:hypothetical protein